MKSMEMRLIPCLKINIEGLEIGADDYLPKPFNFSLLETRITNLIESKKKLFKIFSSKIVVEPAEITSTSTDEQFLRKAIQIVEANIENTEFDESHFVKEMCVSRSLLHKKLTALTNQSTVDFINNIKLKKSVVLLKKAGVNISEVAYSVGFNDPKYFSRIFKKQFGKPPADYQKEIITVSSDS